jgi:D-alanyl-lipoteichoic acid acyltransferase DltB (MBOAT superfamily)
MTAMARDAGAGKGGERGGGAGRQVPFSFLIYFCYILYPPLYVAGPLMSYDDFALQLTRSKEEEEELLQGSLRRNAMWQLVAVLSYGLGLEVVLHYIHLHAVSHNLEKIFHLLPDGAMWIPPWEIMAVGFFMLNFIYVKFLIIWRVAAASAALDLMLTTDNMKRCVCNNYTFAGFWRSWHASLHVWILRYMYLPLGGKKWRLVIAWPIFVFVGIWHDLELRWVAWALLNCACLTVEAVILAAIPSPTPSTANGICAWSWRYLSIGAAVVNIYFMMLSNLAILYGFGGSWDFVVAFVYPPPPGVADVLLMCC